MVIDMATNPRDSDEHYDRRSKGHDEIFCPSCGAIIKKEAEVCPKCGVRQKKTATETNGKIGHKDPGIAAALSFFIAGAGQVYNGEVLKGAGVFVGFAILWIFALVTGLLCSPAPLALWIYAIYDAYSVAKRINGE
jgi:TM2 domain-containing membrane protein YozV